MFNYSEVYIYSDQSTTCPQCGASTAIIMDLSHTTNKTQIHLCSNKKCNYEFVMQYDKEFEEYDLKVIANENENIEIEIFE